MPKYSTVDLSDIGFRLLTIPGVNHFKMKPKKGKLNYAITLVLENKTYLPIVMEQVWSATEGIIVKKLTFEL